MYYDYAIPYVILIACPDYKRPRMIEDFGVCSKRELNSFFINKAADFVYEYYSYNNNFNEIKDVQQFWTNYYDGYYMGNSPWSSRAFINGVWENVTPSDIEIFDRIQKLKIFEQEDK
jgi:hypothetical protein